MRSGIFIPYRWIGIVIIGLVALFWSASNLFAQPPVPHAVPTNIEVDCLSCHQAGVAGAPRLAWDHLGRANEDCEQCHAVSGNWAASILHTLESRSECYDCHLDGSSGAPRVAGNHASYGVDTCQMCHLHEEVVVEEVEEEEFDEGSHILWGLDAGKTCLECHRQQFVDDEHVAIVQAKEPTEAKGYFLWDAYCSNCHGEVGMTEVFPPAQASEDEADGEDKADDEDAAENEAIPGTGVIVGSPEYLSSHDDATIMQAIVALPGNPEHAYSRDYGGKLKFDDVVNLGVHIRKWGEMGAELDLPIPSFSEDVYPIIEKECGGQCHLDKQKGDWSMASYEDMMTTGEHVDVNIIPGDPANSLLAQKLQNRQKIGEMMPTDRQIRSDQISLIVEWIRAGAPDN